MSERTLPDAPGHDVDEDDDDALSQDLALDDGGRVARLWPLATLMLGAALWAQLFGVAARVELSFEPMRLHALMAYLLPLGMIAFAVATRIAVLLLALAPLCLIPGLMLMAEPEQRLLTEGLSMLRLGASLALYLAVASAGAQVARLPARLVSLGRAEAPGAHEDLYRRFVLARIGVMVILFVVPAYGVFQDPEIAAALAQHYGESAAAARTFLGLLHFFVWIVAAYMMVMTPALNLEYDQRALKRALDAQARALTRRAIVRRVGVWVTLGLIAAGALALAFAG